MLQILSDMVKRGRLGRLEVVNLESHPEVVESHRVRSVPWLRLGLFELTGVRSRDELEQWAERAGTEQGLADYFHTLLKEGELSKVLAHVHAQPDSLVALLPIVGNPEASINVRIGAGAVFEDMMGSPALQALTQGLGELSGYEDARVRADACHYLGLTRSPQASDFLTHCLHDHDAEVREIAAESLELIATFVEE